MTWNLHMASFWGILENGSRFELIFAGFGGKWCGIGGWKKRTETMRIMQ
jgi:hypothetical protein